MARARETMASSIGGEVELDSGSNSNELVGWAGIDRIFREGGRGVSFALWVLRHNFRQLIFFFFFSVELKLFSVSPPICVTPNTRNEAKYFNSFTSKQTNPSSTRIRV